VVDTNFNPDLGRVIQFQHGLVSDMSRKMSKKASLSKRVYSILPVALQLWGRIDSEANTQSNKGERILTVIKERNQGTQNGKGDN